MANLVTLSRLVLLLIVAWSFYLPPSPWHFLSFVLAILIFVSDGIDGYIARKRNETSLFGALFDIAGDRIVELTLWIVAADNGLVPIWVPLVFIFRGVIVDTIRSSNAVAQGKVPFAVMTSPLGKFLVASKFMRGFYAAVKGTAFAGLTLLQPFPAVLPTFWSYVDWFVVGVTYLAVYLSVVLCVVRGWPVVAEFVYSQKDDILRRPGKKQ
jgi:CDP-diacylglycerol--glycerol-3-phosphate 3-phosphatidyltransferase